MATPLRTALALATLLATASAHAQLTIYEHENFEGRSITANEQVRNFARNGFNDRSSSAVVTNERWEVCEDRNFQGRCTVLRQGRYASLQAMGMNDRISSVRAISRDARVAEDRYAPAPLVVSDYRRRRDERLFEADVTAVRAVLGQPERRCWVEQEQVAPERRSANVPAALAGALIGGILGHQVGGGSGRDIATVGGAVAGGAVGANIGRNERGQQVTTRDVQRCAAVRSDDRPDYWDVTYIFRGETHQVQMAQPPGRTITVNRRGEPRA